MPSGTVESPRLMRHRRKARVWLQPRCQRFWLYAVLHIALYVSVFGVPGLGFDGAGDLGVLHLVSFNETIAIAGSVIGWLPGIDSVLMRRDLSAQRSGPAILRNVVIGKIVTSVWAAVFVVPLKLYTSFGIVFVGTGLWAVIATVFALTGNNTGRWWWLRCFLIWEPSPIWR